MKHSLKSMLAVAAAAMTFASCVKEEPFQDGNISDVEKVTIEINAEGAGQTKTHMDGTDQVKWNKEGEILQVLEYDGTALVDAETTASTVSEDLTTARFTVDFPIKTASSLDYWGIYPSANFISSSNDVVTKFKIELPDKQHPGTDSFDANADLLISSPVHKTVQPAADGLDFRFHRHVAVVEFTLVGIAKGEKIASVQFGNEKAPLAGRSYYNLNTNKYVDVGYQGQDKKIINALYENFIATGEDKVYITTFPASLQDFKLVVTTDKATYTKEVASTAIELVEGHKKPLKVGNFIREELVLDQYDLLTDASILSEGYRLLITNGNSKDKKSVVDGVAKSMGPKVSGENRIGTVDVTIKSNKISTVPTDAVVITLEGTKDNYLLSTADGYLSLNGTANELKYIASVKDASKWKISVATDGNIDIVSGTRPIRFNNTYFASYKGTTSCSPVFAFYKKGQPKAALAAPTGLAATVAEGTNVANVSWNPVENADSYTVTCGLEEQNVTTTSTTVEHLAWNTTHNITVVANPADKSELYKSSEAAAVDVTVGANPTPLEHLPAGDYAIVAENGGKFYALTPEYADHNLLATPITYSIGAEEVVALKNQIWTLAYNDAADTYSFQNLSNQEYLNMKVTGNNGEYHNADTGTAAQSFTLLKSAEGTYTMTAEDGIHTLGLYHSSEYAFSFDKKNGVNIVLHIVPAHVDTTPVITFAADSFIANADATTLSVPFTRNEFAKGDVTVNVTADSDWLLADIDPDAKGNNILCVFDANTGAERTASLKVSHAGAADKIITVKQSAYVAPGSEQTMTIDLTAKGYADAESVKTVVGTAPLSVVFSDSKWYDSGTAVRMYVAGNLTISGKTISRIVLTCSGSGYTGDVLNVNVGSFNKSGSVVTWTGSSDSVEFSLSKNSDSKYKQLRVQKIEVTFK